MDKQVAFHVRFQAQKMKSLIALMIVAVALIGMIGAIIFLLRHDWSHGRNVAPPPVKR